MESREYNFGNGFKLLGDINKLDGRGMMYAPLVETDSQFFKNKYLVLTGGDVSKFRNEDCPSAEFMKLLNSGQGGEKRVCAIIFSTLDIKPFNNFAGDIISSEDKYLPAELMDSLQQGFMHYFNLYINQNSFLFEEMAEPKLIVPSKDITQKKRIISSKQNSVVPEPTPQNMADIFSSFKHWGKKD